MTYETEQIYFGSQVELLAYLRSRENKSAWARAAMREKMERELAESSGANVGDTPAESRLRGILRQELTAALVDLLRT